MRHAKSVFEKQEVKKVKEKTGSAEQAWAKQNSHKKISPWSRR